MTRRSALGDLNHRLAGPYSLAFPKRGWEMATPSLENSICKLAMAGEQVGFSVEQMIWMLNAGVTLEGLLGLIEWRLRIGVPANQKCPCRWVI